MVSALALGAVLSLQRPGFDFYTHGPYDSAIPRPESILRYGPGEYHTRYDRQDQVVRAIVNAAPDRAKYITIGESVEGRPLRIVAVSSPENIARLESIRTDIAALASGKASDASAIAKRTPAIVWINECIHGNEPASFESGMWLLYTLTASREPALQQALSKTVVIVNPSYNPDGHERYVNWYNSVATGSTFPGAFEHHEPDVVYGRFNHYRFDMNRDRVAMSQPETRQEVAEFLRWNPQVYVDQHGQVSSYFFPPTSMSVNVNVDRARYSQWTEVFGRATAKAFDANGFNYYIKDIFDLYYPGYLDSWSTLSGAIGMTHETDGPRGRAVEESDGNISTLRQAIAKHFTSAIAVTEAAAANSEKLLLSYSDFKRKAATGEPYGKDRFLVVSAPRETLTRLSDQLAAAGIQSRLSPDVLVTVKGRSLWGRGEQTAKVTGVLVVPMAQPQSALVRALFQEKVNFEPEFIQEQMRRRKQATSDEKYPYADPAEFYDLTAWGLQYAHEADAWWTSEDPGGSRVDRAPAIGLPSTSDASIGWAIRPTESGMALAYDLLQSGVRVQATSREMSLEGKSFPPGTMLVLKSRNPDIDVANLGERVAAHNAQMEALFTGYPDSGRQGPGSETVFSVKKPYVGILFGDDSSTTDFGSAWFLFERQLRIPFVPMHKDTLSGDLSRFSAIVFPDGRMDSVPEKLKDWINQGGCAVLLGGNRWAMGDKGLFKLDQVKLPGDKSPGSLPGSIFKAELDPRSFLSYGYPRNGESKIEIAVPVEGGRFYQAKKEGGGAVVFSSDEKANKLLSGWEWEDTEKALQGTVWLHDEPVGRGHVIWFAQDPTSRAMWPGLNRLLLNAVLFGPAG